MGGFQLLMVNGLVVNRLFVCSECFNYVVKMVLNGAMWLRILDK